MNLFQYLIDNIIVSIGNSHVDKYVMVETIVYNPEELLEIVIENNCYISEIRWWDRVKLFTPSEIGYGGVRDPRPPQNYYFAETDICSSFNKNTTYSEYIEYLNSIKLKYSSYELYPSFDICYKDEY